MSPEEIEFRRKMLLSLMNEEAPLLAKVANAVPADRLHWKPDVEKAMTFSELICHAAGAALFFDKLAKGEEPSVQAAPKIRSISDLLGFVGLTQEVFAESVTTLSTEELGTPRSFFGMDHAAIDILSWHPRHLIHHRGQAVTYLRLMGAAVPSTYGSSADSDFTGG